MQKLYAFTLCAGMASVLAVLYVLLQLDWSPPEAPEVNGQHQQEPAGR